MTRRTKKKTNTLRTVSGKHGGRRLRFAVVGLGHIAQVAVLPSFAHVKNAELAALVSGEPRKLRALSRRYHVKKTYSYENYSRCLADPEIDAVYIALPNDKHLDFAIRAARAGKHILCEKPLASNEGDALRMTRAAEAAGVRLMTAYRLHFDPANLATVAAVRSGKIGEVRYFTSSFSYTLDDPGNIRLSGRRGGGPLLDIGIYCLNAARYVIGAEPVEVVAFLGSTGARRFREVEETASVILRFPGGRLAAFTVSFNAAAVGRYQVVGSKGSITLEPAFEYTSSLKQIIAIGDATPKVRVFPRVDQFAGEIESFCEAVIANRKPGPSGWEGVADNRVLDAIFKSARTGRSVKILPLKKAVRRPSPKLVKHKPPVAAKPKVVDADAPHD